MSTNPEPNDNTGITGQRVRRGKGHESIRREALQDPALSFKATGILAYMLSLPDNWRTDAERLSKSKNSRGKAREGRDAMQSGLRELEDAGYLVRRKYQDQRGRWRWDWRYSDNPADLQEIDVSPGHTVDGSPTHGVPAPGLPVEGSPVDIEVLEVEVLEVEKNLEPKPLEPSVNAPASTMTDLFGRTDPSVEARCKPGQDETGGLFEEFWRVYPRKIKKEDARKAWLRAVKGNDPRELINAVARYATSRRGEEPRFTAYASSWLNGQRWLDEPEYARNGSGSGGDNLGNGHRPGRNFEDIPDESYSTALG